MKRRLSYFACFGAAGLLALGACGKPETPKSPLFIRAGSQRVMAAELSGAASNLCNAAQQAAAGDKETASTIFQDRVHLALHQTVAAVEPKDRAAAATLLESKNQVEMAIASSQDTGTLARLMVNLHSAFRSALSNLSVPVGPCIAGA